MEDYDIRLKEVVELIEQNNKDLQKILKEHNLLKEENRKLKEENERLKEFKKQVYAIWEIDEEEEGE